MRVVAAIIFLAIASVLIIGAMCYVVTIGPMVVPIIILGSIMASFGIGLIIEHNEDKQNGV